MRRRKYWTLLRLWWLGTRRPTRLALSMSLAALVLGASMPLAAAVGDASDPAEAGETTTPAAAPEAGSGAPSEETPPASDSVASGEGEDGSGDAADEPASGDDGSSGVGGAEASDTASEATTEDAGDAAPSDESTSDATADAIDETGDANSEPSGDTGDVATEEAGGETAGQPGADDAGSADLTADPAATSDQSDAVSDPTPEALDATGSGDVVVMAENGANGEEAIAGDAAEDGTAGEAPSGLDNTSAASERLELEERERESVAAEIGARLFASMLTYTVDEDLPAPARAPQISGRFADRMSAAAESHDADWALMLGVARALDYGGADPANDALLDLFGRKLSGVEATASVDVVLQHLTLVRADAEQAVALARYHRAVGIDGLRLGLEGARHLLGQRVLAHPEIRLLPEGRADVANGLVGVRVLVVLLYLAEKHDDVVVSSLKSGHRLFARPGVISAHVYGQAVDIAALDGLSILGNQGPGSVTEIAVRDLLSLPTSVYPKQLISLHDMGGPSFADALDHHDHIHIGF